jgi:hypothetical protein
METLLPDPDTEILLAHLRAVMTELALDDDEGSPPLVPSASAWSRERYTRPDPGQDPDEDDV